MVAKMAGFYPTLETLLTQKPTIIAAIVKAFQKFSLVLTQFLEILFLIWAQDVNFPMNGRDPGIILDLIFL